MSSYERSAASQDPKDREKALFERLPDAMKEAMRSGTPDARLRGILPQSIVDRASLASIGPAPGALAAGVRVARSDLRMCRLTAVVELVENGDLWDDARVIVDHRPSPSD